jgi:hypothetical protein
MNYDYKLDHDEIRKVEPSEVALATPLSTCMGIGIYDELSKSGYIAFSAGGYSGIIEDAINMALKEFKDIKRLKVGASGANKFNSTEDCEQNELQDRIADDHWMKLEGLINSYDFDKQKVNLYREKRRGMSQELYLDCNRGRIIFKSNKDVEPSSIQDDYFGEGNEC